MRNPKRIEKIMSIVERIWKKEPDLRFGQIITVIDSLSDNDIFHIEDDEVIELLKQFEKTLDI